MTRNFMILLLMVSLTTASWAGYRTVPEREITRAETLRPRLQKTQEWKATVRRADGSEIKLRNLGDRFASVSLNRRERVDICLQIPGLPDGERPQVVATHGGKLFEQDRTRRITSKEQEICFSYTLGVIGPHPVLVSTHGQTIRLLFMLEEEVGAKNLRDEVESQEARP